MILMETKRTDRMNVCQFYILYFIADLLSLIGILTCDHEIILDDVGLIPASVSAITIDLHRDGRL